MSTLKHQAAEAAKKAREIAEKAQSEGREMTEAERAEFQKNFERATDLHRQAQGATDQRAKDADVLARAKDLFQSVNGMTDDSHRGVWAKSAGETIRAAMPAMPDGSKALVSGTIGVPNVIDPNVVRIGTVPRTVLDLMALKPAESEGDGGNTFSFLRQTVRTNNAAPVADGALKPTSVYTLEEIEDRFRVIAHLSEAVPLRYFADHRLLEDFLRAEMEYGLELAIESQALTGDGTGENLTGILNTSGIVAVPWATDLLTTVRKGITAMQANGTQPTAFVFNPTDAEAFDLIREGSGTGQYLLGGPGSKADQTLWSIPRVVSTALPVGTGILADWTQAELVVREGAEVAIDTGGDLFDRNQAKMRVEGRYGLAVKRPAAFAELDLTAV